MTVARSLPACSSCGRHALPPASDVPPSDAVRAAIVEVLRFAQEFDALDDELYSAVDFADWLALSCMPPQFEPGHRPHRKRDEREPLTLSIV